MRRAEDHSPYLLSVANPRYTVFTTSLEKATRETVLFCEKMGCNNYYTGDGNLVFHVSKEGVKASGIDPRVMKPDTI